MTPLLPDAIRNLSDEKWLELLIESVATSNINDVQFPGFPSEQIQTAYVGSANEETLREAFNFYKLVKYSTTQAKNPIQESSRFLDFGCGWGRYLRFFWKDIKEENLFGCDVDRSIVDLCHQLNVPGQIDVIAPRGKLPYPDSHFDVIMAYSVFTHLPKNIHLHWMREIARVSRPGSTFCLTLEPRRFIDFINDIPESTTVEWYKQLLIHKPRLKEYNQIYDSGDLVFMPTNKGVEDVYGDAAVPPSFIKREWSPYFQVLDYIDDPRQFWQAVLVAQRI